MILVDSNIFMYAAGKSHPAKQPSLTFLESVASGEVDALIDAEVLQEILHRYWALRRPEDGSKVYDLARQIVHTVLPVTVEILDRAHELLRTHPSLSARDAVHAAVVLHHNIEAICSFDSDFDQIQGLTRRSPMNS